MGSDWELLERWARGRDEGAFGELVGRHVNLVYGAALRMLGGPGKGEEDVVQAVFLLLSESRKVSRGGGLEGWLFNATRYCWRECAEGRTAAEDT